MKFILVIERKYLFPGLSPHGFLAPDSLDLERLNEFLFFAEREYMEQNSFFKQVIPYLVLNRGNGENARVLAYQRRTRHSERRLGGLWSLGFGGHIEPLDRSDENVTTGGLVHRAARRELTEETGLELNDTALDPIGFINSDAEAVSSVHFGVVYRVDLDNHPGSDDEILATVSRQAEPHQARWLPAADLPRLVGAGNGPDGGSFEDWSRIVIEGAGKNLVLASSA
ncbi:MAG: NUDIX domain-containing protein [bacterium]